MQKSFQYNRNKGAAGDHTYKFPKLIKATGRSRYVFIVSCTITIFTRNNNNKLFNLYKS